MSIEMEHVDVARFASPEPEEHRLRTMYGSKYRDQRFDVIVAALPEPFQFVLRARDELWPGTPVVVCGVDERSVRDLKPPPGFAVLTTRFDMEGTVRAARALLPATRHVALVGGASAPEQVYHDLIRQAVSAVGALDVIDLTQLPLADVLARVSSLPEHTVVVQSSYQVDGAGRRFFGIDLVPHVSQAANRPVFTPLDLALGRGVVGGSIIDFEDIGRDAGTLASRLLRGAAPPAAPVPSRATGLLRFDGRELARWGLDERRLPGGSEVLYPQPTLWQQYRWHAAATLGLIALEAGLIGALLVQRRYRREAQARLAERLRFETLVSRVGAVLSTMPTARIDEQIHECLRDVGTFLGVDHAALWHRSSDGLVLSRTHAWSVDGVTPPPATIDLERFPYFRARLEATHVFSFDRRDQLPPEAEAERVAFEAAGVRSFAAIPLPAGDRPLGLLAFVTLSAEGAWPATVLQQLQVLAEHCTSALVRMQSAAAIQTSALIIEAVLATLPGETAILDAAGTIVQINEAWASAARSTAGQAALAVGANYLAACRKALDMPADVARKKHAAVESILRGERDEFVVEYPSSRNGEDRWLEVRVRRLARLGGGAAVMRLDVTSRRQAEAAVQRHVGQLAHLDRVAGMGQLASSLAHELNQPLTAILSNAQAASRLLGAPLPDLEELRACLADIISDDQRAAEVIHRMRRLLRKTDFRSLPLALNDLVANTIGLVANDALLHAVSLEFKPGPALPVVYGDLVQIQQVILNLLSNAIAATAATGGILRKVTLRTTVAGPYVELAVHDSGKGIAEGDFERLFEPFFTTKADGLGMGLAISRTIVEAHGGRLLAENDPAGGATFRVHLRTERPDTR
ncbi:MAG: GAF domain-containing protein [Chloroflexi bacterium]|nr:MAG: GAF domain-containing protein [Chloroflexota bacterium]